MSKLPRTIRLDPSDTFVFAPAAEPGEWAVSGAFVFWGEDPETLGPKERTALRAGFLGIESLGWSTLCIVTDASDDERRTVIERLADQLLAKFGAPSREAALAAALEEVTFAEGLCDHPPQTLLAVHRTMVDGEIREQFRVLHTRQALPDADPLHAHARAFTFHEIVEEEGPLEEVDLLALGKTERT